MTIALLADRLFDGQTIHTAMPLSIEQGRIKTLGEVPAGMKMLRLKGMLAPGYIDFQVNGGGGKLFNFEPTVDAIRQITATHVCYGSVGLLLTLITDELSVMQDAADAVSTALRQKIPGVIGLHFEGPHLALERKGIHPAQRIRLPSDAELELFCRQDLGVRVITIAPEMVPPDIIRRLVESGARVCLGHSNADYQTTRRALQAGASGFTHLFNAMSRLQAREPGMVGAALEDLHSWCGLILDGHHVHPATAKVALAAKTRGKMVLVTDAMSLVGTDQTQLPFFGATIFRRGDRLNIETGELAGSMLTMAAAVQNAVQWLELDTEEAIRMATLYPARFLGIDCDNGSLAAGKRADLVLLDEALNVQATWINGQLVYQKNSYENVQGDEGF